MERDFYELDFDLLGMSVLERKPKPPKPIEKPLIIPPIRIPEVEKKHIKKDGKK